MSVGRIISYLPWLRDGCSPARAAGVVAVSAGAVAGDVLGWSAPFCALPGQDCPLRYVQQLEGRPGHHLDDIFFGDPLGENIADEVAERLDGGRVVGLAVVADHDA